jgi:hypothetical protein
LKDASECSINKDAHEFLQKQLMDKEALLTLHYRGSRDGWMLKDFHKRSDKKGATLTLLQIEYGDCIGGFTNRQWSSPEDGEWKSDPGAILFNLSRSRSFPC